VNFRYKLAKGLVRELSEIQRRLLVAEIAVRRR
jgi:hypothetical protein